MMINGNYERIQLLIEYLFEDVRKNLYGNGLESRIFNRMKPRLKEMYEDNT